MAVKVRTGQFGSYYGNEYNSSNALNQTQMETNATYIYNYLTSKGWTINSIAALLGNMQAESTINPGRWQGNNVGTGPAYGLVQWDPFTKYTEWASSNGFSDPSEMDSNLSRIVYEVENSIQWYGRGDYSDMSFEEFATSSEPVSYLAVGFLLCYERPADQSESVQEYRSSLAQNWYTYLTGKIFEPRLNSEGMEGSYYWYEGNPFYQAGYGLPNCTCYTWGRFWEISDTAGDYSNRPTLPTGDAGTWFENVSGYETGTKPKLGAVICWSDNSGGAGHVAIVEEIAENGDITVSQSGYGSSYFWTNTKLASEGYSYSDYTFQGFIYNPHITTGGSGGGGTIKPTKRKRNKFKFILFNKRRKMYG